MAAAAASSGSADIVEFVREGKNRWVFIGGLAATIVVLAVIGRVANAALERVVSGGGGGGTDR